MRDVGAATVVPSTRAASLPCTSMTISRYPLSPSCDMVCCTKAESLCYPLVQLPIRLACLGTAHPAGAAVSCIFLYDPSVLPSSISLPHVAAHSSLMNGLPSVWRRGFQRGFDEHCNPHAALLQTGFGAMFRIAALHQTGAMV